MAYIRPGSFRNDEVVAAIFCVLDDTHHGRICEARLRSFAKRTGCPEAESDQAWPKRYEQVCANFQVDTETGFDLDKFAKLVDHINLSDDDLCNMLPKPVLEPGPRPPPCSCTWHQRSNRNIADVGYTIDDYNLQSKSLDRMYNFMTHLGSTMFSDNQQGFSWLSDTLVSLVRDQKIDVVACTTQSNRFIQITCKECGQYCYARYDRYTLPEQKQKSRELILEFLGYKSSICTLSASTRPAHSPPAGHLSGIVRAHELPSI